MDNKIDFKSATIVMNALADILEHWDDSGFTRERIVLFVRKLAESCAVGVRDAEKEYREQLRFCVEHNMICFEYYRRHGVVKRQHSTGKGKAVQA